MSESSDIHSPSAFKPFAVAAHWGEGEFRRLLEKLPAGAYTCDPQGLITYYNQHAVALWGRAPKLNDPIDRFCGSFKLFSADGAPINHDQCWMALALNTNSEYNGHEIIVQRPSGERLTVLAYANPFRDEAGKLLGAANVLVDITDRKRAEVVLRDADRSKDEFLATLAHELRNPLAPVRSAVEILQLQSPQSQDSKWALEVIDRQMRQMTRLIDDLLDVSRITQNKLELRRQRVALAEILHSAIETSRPLIDEALHELIVNIPPQPMFLDADSTRLSQAVSNLLNNAARYTDSGGRIILEAERQGSDVLLTVRDTGIGIPAEMLSRVFEMFAQGERPRWSRVSGGLGIGLTLVKRLIEMHGGRVHVHSDGPGKGSAFVLRLPLVIDSAVAARTGLPGALHGAITASSAPLRILVADDNRDAVTGLAMLLRIRGHEVRTAYDGAEAIAVADEFHPAVALLDIGMPNMNGYDAARHLRRQPWAAHSILIAVTGWGQAGDRRRAAEAGFDHHIVKPVDPAALVQLLSARSASVGQSGDRA